MKYKYKSINIDYIENYTVSNLHADDDYYYFESNQEIKEAKQILDEEFKKSISNVVHVDIKNTNEVSQPTQLDRIESLVSKSQEQIAQEARDAYTLELIEGGVIA